MAPVPPIQDLAVAVPTLLSILFLQLPTYLLTKAYHDVRGQGQRLYHGMPVSKLAELFVIRSVITYLPISVTRFSLDITLPGRILQSARYAPSSSHLYQHVDKQDFKGVWMVRNGFSTSSTSNNDLDPTTSDIVIYYLHGGGYVINTPATFTLFLLQLAEVITRGGKTVSIFVLDYDLAPEAVYPRQLVQARKGYDWLIGDKTKGGMGIDKRNVVIMGDSAGGHLSLSLLVDLWRPLLVEGRGFNAMASFLKDDTEDHKPGLGVMMLSPWLSLFRVTDSFNRNALTDLISQKFLYDVGSKFIGPESHGELPEGNLPWLEFVDGKNGIVWDEVLPEWVWVSAGKYEILYDDIVRWVNDRLEDCGGGKSGRVERRIVGDLNKGEVHDHAWLQTADQFLSRRVCGMNIEENSGIEEFEAIERIGTALLERYKVAFGK